MNLDAEVERLFDDSSVPVDGQPTAVIIWGGVAAGKTTFRKQNHTRGFVLIDAADIFRSLSGGKVLPFPGPFEQQIDQIGQRVAERALSERRHIVTEVIGVYDDILYHLTACLRSIGYLVDGRCMTCDVDEAVRRHECRSEGDVSAYNAEGFQFGWIVRTCQKLLKDREVPDSASAGP